MVYDLVILLAINFVLWLWVFIVPVFFISAERLPFRAFGMVLLPGLILVRADIRHFENILRHELMHHAQIKRYSPLGAALYLGWFYGKGFLFDKKKFWLLWQENPLEVEAIAAMNVPTKQKYIKLYK